MEKNIESIVNGFVDINRRQEKLKEEVARHNAAEERRQEDFDDEFDKLMAQMR